MISPVTDRHQIDEGAVEKLITSFIRTETYPFILGTTGESQSLPMQEKKRLIDLVTRYGQGRTTLYAGISSNCYEETVTLGQYAADQGVDVLVAHLPSYYPMGESHMTKYFESLVEAVTLPLFIYNIPLTTHLSIPLQVVRHLSEHPRIVGLKDSERGEQRLQENLDLWADRPDFSFVIGWAAKTMDAVSRGADGTVPSTGNLLPGQYKKVIELIGHGDRANAARYQQVCDEVSAFYQQGRLLSEAIPLLKYLGSLYHICTAEVLPPMMPVPEPMRAKIQDDFAKLVEKHALKIEV